MAISLRMASHGERKAPQETEGCAYTTKLSRGSCWQEYLILPVFASNTVFTTVHILPLPEGNSVNGVTTSQPAHAVFYCHVFSCISSSLKKLYPVQATLHTCREKFFLWSVAFLCHTGQIQNNRKQRVLLPFLRLKPRY